MSQASTRPALLLTAGCSDSSLPTMLASSEAPDAQFAALAVNPPGHPPRLGAGRRRVGCRRSGRQHAGPSRVGRSVMLLVLLAHTACAAAAEQGGAVTSPAAARSAMVTISIDNQTRHAVTVHFVGTGLSSIQLGQVTTMNRRDFRVPSGLFDGSIVLHAVPHVSAAEIVRAAASMRFSTIPFELNGARSVEWRVREEAPVSAAALR
jgi:hypothetical protein